MEPSGIRNSVRVRTDSSVQIDLRATLLLLALFSRQTIQRCPLRTQSRFPRTLRPSASAWEKSRRPGGDMRGILIRTCNQGLHPACQDFVSRRK